MDHFATAADTYAEYLIQMCKQKPSLMVHSRSDSKSRSKSIHQKLAELYVRESHYQPRDSAFVKGPAILKKLVVKEKLNVLEVTLYPGNKGFSLLLKTSSGCDLGAIHLPYEEGDLLEYIDNEQLPPLLLDLLEKSPETMFYNGCVVVEVRDFRKSSSTASNFVLLKPTNQSLVSDLQHITTSNGRAWTTEDKQRLESSLVLATAEPICLDPSISVTFLMNKIYYHKNLFSKPNLKRAAKSHSLLTYNKKAKLALGKAPPTLRLLDFLRKKRKKNASKWKRKRLKTLDSWNRPEPELTLPDTIDVLKNSTYIPPSNPSPENEVRIVEEYVMEVQDKNCSKMSYTHITILQNSVDEQYLGQLFIGKDGQDSGSSSVFKLGDKVCVQMYVKQFTKIFTEKGMKSVKITRLIPGQPPSITYTQSAKENMADKFKQTSVTVKESSGTSLSNRIKNETQIKKQENIISDSPSDTVSMSNMGSPVYAQRLNLENGILDQVFSECAQITHEEPLALLAHRQEITPISIGGLTNLGLHSLMPMSLTALPLSLTMVNSGPPTFLTSPTTGSLMVAAEPLLTSPPNSQYVQLGGSAGDLTSSTGMATLGPVIVSSGVINPVSTVLSSPPNLLSLNTQSLAAQLMASSGLKPQLAPTLLSHHPLVRHHPPPPTNTPPPNIVPLQLALQLQPIKQAPPISHSRSSSSKSKKKSNSTR